MPASVEQLHYTWTPRGVEGANRFQIAAISPGFRSAETTGAMAMVRRLCSYEHSRDGSDPPVSFGWLDHEGFRMAFNRIGLPPARGRPGNFAAHILLGKPEALPEGLLGRSFGSSFWWRGSTEEELEAIASGRRSFELPPVDLEAELEAGANAEQAVDSVDAGSLAHALFMLPEDGRLGVLAEGAAVGKAVRAVAYSLPEALTGITLSTYEGKRFFPFQVLGTTAPEPAMQTCALGAGPDCDEDAKRVLDRLLAANRGGERLRAVAAIAASRGEAPRAAAWKAVQELIALGDSDEEVAMGVSTALMSDPEAVALLAEGAKGRERVAAAVHEGSPLLLAALSQAMQLLDPPSRMALAETIGSRYGATRRLSGCAAVLGSLPDGPEREAAQEKVFAIAAVDDLSADALGPDDAVLLLEVAAQRKAQPTMIEALLRAAGRHLDRLAGVEAVPDDYLAAMLVERAAEPGAAGVVARTLRARPALAHDDILQKVDALVLLGLAEKSDGETKVAILPHLLVRLVGTPALRRAAAVAWGLPPAQAVPLVEAALRQRDRSLPADELDRLADELSAVLLGQNRLEAAQQLLGCSGSGQARRALDLLRTTTSEDEQAALKAVALLGEIEGETLRDALGEMVLARAIAAIVGPGDVGLVWQGLDTLQPLASDQEKLRRLLTFAEEGHQELPTMLILGWIGGHLVEHRRELMSPMGRLDDETEALVQPLFDVASDWSVARIQTLVDFQRRRARKWWARLERHRKKKSVSTET